MFKKYFMLGLYLLSILSLTGDMFIVSPVNLHTAESARAKYIISAVYNPAADEVTGTTKIILKPDTPAEFYLQLYPNVFSNWKYEQAKRPKQPGWLKVTDIKVDGRLAATEMQNDTLLKISAATKPKIVEMKYNLHLPRGGTRLNTFLHTAVLAQWYPMLTVKDSKGWHNAPFLSVGDPFCTEMADYEVTFQVPEGYQVITSGGSLPPATTIQIAQENIRDFAAVITKDYKVKSRQCRDTEIKLWYLAGMEDVVDKLHDAACTSFNFYSQRFGAYPYRELAIVLGETGQGIAGMEYPGLVTSLPRITIDQDILPAVNVVAHEVAHQWWYGLVGNDQVAEPWLDEGLTSFSEFWYMEKCHGQKRRNRRLLQQIVKETDRCHRLSAQITNQSLDKYPEHLYGLMVYLRPTAMMYDLVDRFGEERVMKFLYTYCQRYKNKLATGEDFKQTANEVFGEDLTNFFNKWLNFN